MMVPQFSIADGVARDPFAPYAVEKPKTTAAGDIFDAAAPALTPLTERPLSSYQVIGVIVSPTDSVALIKSRDKRELFASIGDAMGSEGGKVEVISSEGITVDTNGKISNLTVSNRFDTPDESN